MTMGGQGIGGHEAKSAPAFCAQVAQSWPRLRATSPALAHLDGVTHSIPMLDEFMEHYTDLVTECGEIAHEHKRLNDAFFYTTVRGGKEHYFNPKSLPPVPKLPSATRLVDYCKLTTNRANSSHPPSGSSLSLSNTASFSQHATLHRSATKATPTRPPGSARRHCSSPTHNPPPAPPSR